MGKDIRFQGRVGWAALALLLANCNGAPDVPRNPTWAEVEPILRANCNHCHGPTAAETGSKGGLVYRFDFYDMNAGSCGDAAEALEPGQSYAAGWAALIKDSITPEAGDSPRMPPAPARALADWEHDTIVRWASAQVPPRGIAGRGNRRPQAHVEIPVIADVQLTVRASVDDPDGESVVGVVKIGSFRLKMPRPGTFATTLNTAKWPTGFYDVSAVVCDGWSAVTYPFGQIGVLHGEAQATRPIASEREDGAPNPPATDAGSPSPADTGTSPQVGDAGASLPSPDASTTLADMRPPTTAPSPDAVASTHAPPSARPVGECPDLNENGALDCKETLVINPDFDKNGASWQPETGAQVSFSTADAFGDPASGALLVKNVAAAADLSNSVQRTAWQCVPAKGGATYDIFAQAFVPGGQSSGGGNVSAWFYGSSDCSGRHLQVKASPGVAATNRWHLLSFQPTAPTGASSMAIRLGVARPFRNLELSVLFDNVLVLAR